MSAARCFVGLPLPAEVTAPLVAACDAIRAEAPSWRGEKWVAEANLHVTLAFIGNVAEEALPFLADAVGAAVAASRAFQLEFVGIRAVPNPHRCRMLWAAFDDPDGLCADLAARVVAASVPFGAEQPDREFHAHATLARARTSRRLPTDALDAGQRGAMAVPTPMSVLSATLFTSTLTPPGPKYDAVGRWLLSGT